MAHFIGHHATSHGSAESTSRHSLLHHLRRSGSGTLVEEEVQPAPSPDAESLQGERRAHRSDLVEERPEGDLPDAAFTVVPAGTEVASTELGPKDSASSSKASLEVPSKPALSTRTSAMRLQAAAKRITAARIILNGDGDGMGRAPGIDPAKVDMPGLKADVVLQAVDCNREKAEFHCLDSTSLVDFLVKERPSWSKVRWIHANGLSWDVIKLLGLKYDLHPLAIEDMLHQSSVRSKLDYYRNHAFLSLVVHRTLNVSQDDTDTDDEREQKAQNQPGGHRFGFHSTRRGSDEESIVEARRERSGSPGYGSGATTPGAAGSYQEYIRKLNRSMDKIKTPAEMERRTLSHNTRGLANRIKEKRGSKKFRKSLNERAAARWTVAELTKDVKVHIHVEQFAVFLLRNGAILSFTQDPGFHPQFSAILDRMSSPDDLIRESEDASMVLQAMLDAVGDDMLDIVDEFRDQLTTLESHVLSRPSLADVRHLHVLSSQLLMLKSTFTPFQYLLHALRTQDDAKAAAAAGSSLKGLADGTKHAGFVSHEAKVYLGDVIDHVDSVLSSLDLFGDLSENLVAFTFNNLSYSSNSYMQALSVLSVVFLPLTFLSGFFGMNWSDDYFTRVLAEGVSLFWQISIPVVIVTVLIFGYEYIYNMVISLRRLALRLYHRSQVEKRFKSQ